MKFIIATLAATASALPWEKEIACGFDAACGFDVVIDEATGCGFDNGLGVGVGSGSYDPKKVEHLNSSSCSGCKACKEGDTCGGCNGDCQAGGGGCDSDSGCRNGSCGDSGASENDWCIGGVDCEASPDMVCNGCACDEWCPNASVECILDCLPENFSPCCQHDQANGGFGPGSKARGMALQCVKDCNKTGPDGDLMGHMNSILGKGWEQGCCGCCCNFGCSCNCSGKCGHCGCSSCSGNCEVNADAEADEDPHVLGAVENNPGLNARPHDDFRGYYRGAPSSDEAKLAAKYAQIAYAAAKNDKGKFIRHRPELRPEISKKYDIGGSYKIATYVSDKSEPMMYSPGMRDVQCGFDMKSQKWVDIKCGFDNSCGFDFECGFDAECGFDVVKNSKCGFDLAQEQLGCGFDTKSDTWVNVQCGFDNNCGFDIRA